MSNSLSISQTQLFEFGFVLYNIGNSYARFWAFLDNVTATSFHIYTHKKFLEMGDRDHG
jgi:hypothetical protein